MMIPAKVSCMCCGHEGYEIEFLRCTQCLERFCLAPVTPCIRGCKCSTPRPPLASSLDATHWFQQELRHSERRSSLLP
jgi:hypothetical protein